MTKLSSIINHPVHQEISNQLLNRLDYIRLQPKTILIIGNGIDYALNTLQRRYPSATIKVVAPTLTAIQAIESNTQDLVIAYFALLDTASSMDLLREIFRVLRVESLLLFTSLGPDTFFELRDSFSIVDDCAHTHTFLDMHHMGDWMKQLYFSDPVVDREEMTIAYESIESLCADLKNSDIKNNHPLRRRSMMSKNQWQKMLSRYAQYKTEDYFPLTLEIVYGQGWKVAQHQKQSALGDEIVISVDHIQRRGV
ncbi:MAG: hypothetical protein COY58_03930 [Gammaproteobacteria bacterium CG_4_10_14_0_8_um_filter_38_16]|nr:MAG: hypothetical protein COY58_03930 [Gammaproteobacteria bacterium CG_4_10_14_0_8_um_filter_38_16]PJA03210.1 MAG: hypothetical protein COX72_06455 [Gammaproteobacteria bacterium CG_4_10_14_0_2_um_filter_38_22]PJB10329.1 MAG: hypothetical protein CO120_05350 [Gammaproteobacteria bacterium CG_4_9_14_3_um_filter_38_9]